MPARPCLSSWGGAAASWLPRRRLSQVLRGHYGNYGLIFNHQAMRQFYEQVKRLWFKALQRRSQKSKMTWTKFDRLQKVFPLSKPTTHQPWYKASV